MAEMTLENLNALLAQAKISEFSPRDKVYLLVFNSERVSMCDVMGLVEGLAKLEVKCVAVNARGEDYLKAFTTGWV